MEKQTPQKEKAKRINVVSFPTVNPNAAGIDVAAMMHAVAVPPDRGPVNVKMFGAFTEDLVSIAEYLQESEIDKVAMESTGVYWKQLYLVLIERGFEVSLVNAKHVKNVTGRKTDMDDAQWIQKLHSCGLLTSSFLPDDSTESLRSLVRHRKRLIEDSSRYVLRMEKALELMNIKIQGVISDLMGKSGTAILEAILAGERDPENFMQYVDYRIKAKPEDIKKSLQGNWRTEHLFLLEENYKLYGFLQERIISCEKEIELHLQQMTAINNEGVIEPISEEGVLKKKKDHRSKNQPEFDVRGYLLKIHGVDVIDIFGIGENSALEILAETGTDLSKWENDKKFINWLNLCPNNKITGGKLISSTVLKKKAGIATKAFRAAANSLKNSDNWLGDYFRKKRSQGGNKYAIIATARKIAIIYYKMVRYKKGFKPIDTEEYRESYKAAKIARLEKQLARLKGAA